MSDAILAKIRKLLAKAEDPACTPAESAAFTAKATELIAKYGVDSALLAAADPARDPVGDLRIKADAPYARDKCGLLASVAVALRCRAVRVHTDHGLIVHLFGHAADLRRTELLFTSLLVQAAHGLASAPVPGWQHPATFRRSWLGGFTEAIYARLLAAESAAVSSFAGVPSTGRSVALVLADRTAVVAQRVAQEYPDMTTAPRRRLSGSGRWEGYAAGNQADLGGGRITASGT